MGLSFSFKNLSHVLLFATTSLFWVYGCIKVPEVPPDANPLGIFDAGMVPVVDARPCNPGDPNQLSQDLLHCGMCNNACDPVISDRCENGTCQCGLDAPCESSFQECRFGVCRDQDPHGRICEFDGNCPGGNGGGFGCIVGRCTRISCEPEVCDGLDNDCDGNIDGNVSGPLAQYCYDRDVPADVPLSPPCQRGVQLCVLGEWSECEGSVSPRAESGTFGCDGIDNNCDGCVDGNATGGDMGLSCSVPSTPMFDIIYAIDTSGSMARITATVIAATRSFTDRFAGNPNFHFGIVLVPGTYEQTGTPGVPQPFVLSRLVPYEIFISILVLENFQLSTGLEPSWDAVYELGQGILDVGWRPSAARIIILFTDENGQSYRSPAVDEEEMCRGLESGESLYYFTEPAEREDWDSCGTYAPLSSLYEQVLMDLDAVIADPCAP